MVTGIAANGLHFIVARYQDILSDRKFGKRAPQSGHSCGGHDLAKTCVRFDDQRSYGRVLGRALPVAWEPKSMIAPDDLPRHNGGQFAD